MSTMTKVFIVLTSVLAIVSSSLMIATGARWTNLEELRSRQEELAQAANVRAQQVEAVAAANLAIKDDALREAQRILAEKEAKIQELARSVADLRTDLARQTNEKVSAEAGRKKLEEILDVQMAELTNTQKQNQELLKRNIDLETRNQRMATRLLEVTGNLTIATEQIRNLQEKLFAAEQRCKELEQALASGVLPTVAAAPPAGVVAVSPLVTGPIRGEITGVDGRYVSINVGESSGVVPGMTFMVYRGGTYIGDLQIESVRPKESGGKVTMLAPGQQVGPGDRVAYGLDSQ